MDGTRTRDLLGRFPGYYFSLAVWWLFSGSFPATNLQALPALGDC